MTHASGLPAGDGPSAIAGSSSSATFTADRHFREPWEAQAFAIALNLYEQGVFTWPEWAAALAAQINMAQARGEPDDGSRYYAHWLAALEWIVAEKGLATPALLDGYRTAWDRAAHRTPHGHPIELAPADFAGATRA